MKCNRKILFKLLESVKWAMRIAKARYIMRRKGHNDISFLVGHFGEPRRKLRLTTKRFQNCFPRWPVYVLGRQINAPQFAGTRTISILNYDYAILDGYHLRSRSSLIPHHLRVFPFAFELHDREYWFHSLFILCSIQPAEQTLERFGWFESNSILERERERKLIGFLGRLEKIDDGLDWR